MCAPPDLDAPDEQLQQADRRKHHEYQRRGIGDGEAVVVVLNPTDDIARGHVVLGRDKEDDGGNRGHGANEAVDKCGENGWPKKGQDHAAEGLPRVRAKGQRRLVERLVELRHAGNTRPHANRHVSENEAYDQDDAGTSDLDRRHVEG